NFYGTTFLGGDAHSGTVFRLTPTGVFSSLYSFTGHADGNTPIELVLGNDGNFYGTTVGDPPVQGLHFPASGTVFQITTNGDLATLGSFAGGVDGYWPNGLTLGRDGNFYGTTILGGDWDDGILFKITASGGLTKLASFDGSNGRGPIAR